MLGLETINNAAGPESLADYFQKGALLGHKAALNLWYVVTRQNSQKLFPCTLRSVIFAKDLVPLLTQKSTFLKIVS